MGRKIARAPRTAANSVKLRSRFRTAEGYFALDGFGHAGGTGSVHMVETINASAKRIQTVTKPPRKTQPVDANA